MISPLRFVRAAGTVLAASALVSPLAADHPDAGRASLATTPAPLGGPFTTTLRSTDVGAPAVIAMSAGNGPLVLPGLPPIHLDLGSLVLLAVGPIDATGRFPVTVTVPADPALVGAGAHLQGFVAATAGVHASDPAQVRVAASALASFTDATATLPPPTALANTDAGFADLDGDGDLDLLLATATGPAVLTNDGAGLFSDATAAWVPASIAGEPASCVEAADVDGDGDLDVVVGGGLSAPAAPPVPNRLLVNAGGSFVLAPGFPPGNGFTQGAAFADVDGDGDLDLALANGPDSTHATLPTDADTLLVNDGSGGFVENAAFAVAAWNDPAIATLHVAAGDVDNDGDPDLFLSTTGSGPGVPNKLVRNEGGLLFVEVTDTQLLPAPAPPTKSFESAFVDVNGDGWLDLVVAGSAATGSAPPLYLNAGAAAPGVLFEAPANFPQSGAFPITQNIRIGLAVGDVDSDGDPDVLASVHHLPSGPPPLTAGESLLFLNQGGAQGGALGVFEVDPGFTTFGDFIADDAALGDVDGDGDLDAYVAAFGNFSGGPTQDRLLRNALP